MKNKVSGLIEKMNASKYLVSDEDYSVFITSFNSLKEEIDASATDTSGLISGLMAVFNDEAEDIETLMEVLFFIFDLEQEKKINTDEFIKIIFMEFEKMKEERISWVGTFATSMMKIEYMEAMKRRLANADEKILMAFENVCIEFIHDKSLRKTSVLNAKEILKFIENSNIF